MIECLKQLVWRLPYPVLLRAHRGLQEVQSRPGYEACRRRAGMRSLEHFDLSTVRKSDTVFIFGGGASINRISEDRWAQIAAADSIGMNFWIAHLHRPSLYMFELIGGSPVDFKPPDSPQEAIRLHVRTATQRADYDEIPKVALELRPATLAHWRKLPESFRSTCYSLWNPFALARSHDELRVFLNWLDRRGVFSSPRIREMFKGRGSLPTAIGIALTMGYRDIVLCGIDLRAGYFFHDKDRYPELCHFRRPRPGQLHATAEPDRTMMGMKDLVVGLQKLLARPRGQRLWVESANSGLYPEITVFDY